MSADDAPRPDLSATVPDWTREIPGRFWDPSRKLLRSIRRYQSAAVRRTLRSQIERRRWALCHWFWSVITQAEIPLSTQIGGGLMLPHANGIVIHPDVEIGPNCLIMQQVTIGSTHLAGVPRIGGHVDIGAGARILGPVRVGAHALIGANAVVLTDVPDRATAVGVPARIIRRPK